MPTKVMKPSQLQQLMAELGASHPQLPSEAALRRMRDLLDATQNPGPQNDGSISPRKWTTFSKYVQALAQARLCAALLVLAEKDNEAFVDSFDRLFGNEGW